MKGNDRDHDSLFDLRKYEEQSASCAAALHTENGHICVEALAAPVRVQSFASGFDACSAKGWMQLKPSMPPHHIVLFQLHPGESIYIGPLSLSIVPQEHAQFPLLSSPYTVSRYDSYVEQVSQTYKSLMTKLEPSVMDTPLTARHYMALTLDQDKASRVQSSPLHRIKESADEHPYPRSSEGSTIIRDDYNGSGNISSESIRVKTRNQSPVTRQQRESVRRGAKPQDLAICDDIVDAGSEGEATTIVVSSPKPIPQRQNTAAADAGAITSVHEHASSEEDTGESMLSTIRLNMLGQVRDKDNTLYEKASVEHETSSGPVKEMPDLSSSKSMDDHKASMVALDSSMRSMRSAVREEVSSLSTEEASIRVVFASSSAIGGSKQFTKFLRNQGIRIVDAIQDCSTLCVGKGELKKTSKMIMAVLLGKQIVTDDWVIDSAKAGKHLDVERYLARDKTKEAEWGIHLDEAIERGTHGVRPFHGWTIVFTRTAKKDAGKSGFDGLKDLAMMAGAKEVSCVLPKKPMEETPRTLVIASGDDPSLAQLKRGWRCFVREIMGISILRGVLDPSSDEFLVQPAVEEAKGSKKRKR
ncbi:MAG: hypothetical protein Q9217_004028 [Psora testacea]